MGHEFTGRVIELEDEVRGVSAGRCPARSVMEELVQGVGNRERELTSVFTHRLPLDRGPQAYALFAERRDGCVKVALEV